MTQDTTIPQENYPLCVDLDGTLISTDTLSENTIGLIKKNPFYILLLPLWLAKGKSYLKDAIAKRSPLNPALLPYNQEIINFIKQQPKSRTIILASGTNERIATAVANHTKLFSQVFASSINHNGTGTEKANTLIHNYGDKKFDYIGNSFEDLPVWRHARYGHIVSRSTNLINQARQEATIKKIFTAPPISYKTWLKQLRIHQWTKNILLFIPLITAHKIFEPNALAPTIIGFLSFCAMASTIYIMNDAFDLSADRQHLTKKNRPLASGKISLVKALQVASGLLITSYLLAIVFLTPSFIFWLSIYAVANIIYSLWLKKIIIIDVILLASLYTLRIIAGSTAANITTSTWLFMFALFIFLSLALIKRTSELVNLKKVGQKKSPGRGYKSTHLKVVALTGLLLGYTSLITLSLYIKSAQVQLLYTTPLLLWLLIPLLFVWISRLWKRTWQGQMQEDPIVFAIQDTISYATGITAIAILILAT